MWFRSRHWVLLVTSGFETLALKSTISRRGIAKRAMTNILSAVGGSDVDKVKLFVLSFPLDGSDT